jgi:hypothetical protein
MRRGEFDIDLDQTPARLIAERDRRSISDLQHPGLRDGQAPLGAAYGGADARASAMKSRV